MKHLWATALLLAAAPAAAQTVETATGDWSNIPQMRHQVGATIDADYRGEVKVILANLGDQAFEVIRGERIAQLVPAPVVRASFAEAKELGETDRGGGGFGSTGR